MVLRMFLRAYARNAGYRKRLSVESAPACKRVISRLGNCINFVITAIVLPATHSVVYVDVQGSGKIPELSGKFQAFSGKFSLNHRAR